MGKREPNELEKQLIQDAKALWDKYGTQIPKDGQMSILVFPNNLSVQIANEVEKGKWEYLAYCWVTPKDMEIWVP